MNNRVFRKAEPISRKWRASLADVTAVAFACGCPFRVYVSRHLLSTYTISGVAHDDEGELFIENLLGDVFAAMTGQIPSTSISHGKSFSMTFECVVEHRRRSTLEILKLSVLIGPCDGDLKIYVSIAPEARSGGDALNESNAF